MASRFISGGTIAGDGEPQLAASTAASPPAKAQQWDKEAAKKTTEWEAVQKDLEADRRRREEARRAQVEGGAGGESRSLYDVLQANKAAKQAAFEEQNRIRNQFRALDDDEIDFLEGVRDERRIEEERVKRETEERLASFREAQKAGTTSVEGGEDATGGGDNGGDDAVGWTSGPGKKRKRGDKDTRGIVKGVKRRTSELEKEAEEAAEAVKSSGVKAKVKKAETKTTPATHPNPDAKPSTTAGKAKPLVAKETQEKLKPKPKLGLVDYGSDEDEDD